MQNSLVIVVTVTHDHVAPYSTFDLSTMLKSKLRDSTKKWDGLVVVCFMTDIIIWDIFKDTKKILKGHLQNLSSVVQLSDGNIVSNADDDEIIVWDPNSSICLNTISLTEIEYVTMISYIRYDLVLAECNRRETQLWNVYTGELVASSDKITSASINKTYQAGTVLDNGLLTSIYENRLLLLNFRTLQKVKEIETTLRNNIQKAVEIAPNIVAMYSSTGFSNSSVIQIWNVDQNKMEVSVDIDRDIFGIIALEKGLFAVANTTGVDVMDRKGDLMFYLDTGRVLKMEYAGNNLLVVQRINFIISVWDLVRCDQVIERSPDSHLILCCLIKA
jgi:WD40 repeat protein